MKKILRLIDKIFLVYLYNGSRAVSGSPTSPTLTDLPSAWPDLRRAARLSRTVLTSVLLGPTPIPQAPPLVTLSVLWLRPRDFWVPPVPPS